MAHAQISVEPFGGFEKKGFGQFQQLFQRANFLQLHLRDDALRFYQTLPAAIRGNVPNSLTALREHFCNPHLQEVHVLKLEQLKFDPRKDSPENYLVNLTKKSSESVFSTRPTRGRTD